MCSKRWRGEDGKIKKYSATHASNSYTMVTRNFVPFTYKHSSIRRALWQKVRKHCSVTVGGGLADKGGGLMSLLTNWEIEENLKSTKRIGICIRRLPEWSIDLCWPFVMIHNNRLSSSTNLKLELEFIQAKPVWHFQSAFHQIDLPPWSRLNSHIEKTGKILRKVFLKRRFASRTHGGWENSGGGWNMLTL